MKRELRETDEQRLKEFGEGYFLSEMRFRLFVNALCWLAAGMMLHMSMIDLSLYSIFFMPLISIAAIISSYLNWQLVTVYVENVQSRMIGEE